MRQHGLSSREDQAALDDAEPLGLDERLQTLGRPPAVTVQAVDEVRAPARAAKRGGAAGAACLPATGVIVACRVQVVALQAGDGRVDSLVRRLLRRRLLRSAKDNQNDSPPGHDCYSRTTKLSNLATSPRFSWRTQGPKPSLPFLRLVTAQHPRPQHSLREGFTHSETL
eukprot:2619618-Prymnesium_polylepis.1